MDIFHRIRARDLVEKPPGRFATNAGDSTVCDDINHQLAQMLPHFSAVTVHTANLCDAHHILECQLGVRLQTNGTDVAII